LKIDIANVVKFADDAYLVIPSVNSRSCIYGRNIAQRNVGTNNNLKLNCGTRGPGGQKKSPSGVQGQSPSGDLGA